MKSRLFGALAIALVAGLIAVPASIAQEKKTEILTDKAGKVTAGSADFNAELGLAFASLNDLGTRINAARSQGDPVGLANAARELGIAESVSGKKAKVTSEALTKEATELAKMRFDPKELEAVILITGEKGLTEVCKKATKVAAEEKAKRDSGEATRGIQGTLHVDSRYPEYINIYVDGRFVGTVPPYGDRWFYIGQTPWETTFLRGQSPSGLWTRAVGAAVNNYKWTLTP